MLWSLTVALFQKAVSYYDDFDDEVYMTCSTEHNLRTLYRVAEALGLLVKMPHTHTLDGCGTCEGTVPALIPELYLAVPFAASLHLSAPWRRLHARDEEQMSRRRSPQALA